MMELKQYISLELQVEDSNRVSGNNVGVLWEQVELHFPKYGQVRYCSTNPIDEQSTELFPSLTFIVLYVI